MTWAAVWRFLKSWPGGVVVGAVGALVAVAILSARPSAAPGPTPYTAEPTKRAAEADKVTEPLDVQVLKPEAEDRAKIARDYREPGILVPAASNDAEKQATSEKGPKNMRGSEKYSAFIPGSKFAVEILDEVKFEPAPDGGTALTTVDRTTGLPRTTVLPKRGLSLRNRWLLGGSYGRIETHDPAEPWAEVWRARAAWTPACRRAACASLEAGVLGGWKEPTAYGLVEISVGNR